MKRFWQGFGTAVVVVAVAVFLVYPQYADYRTRAETSQMMNYLKTQVTPRIEEKALKAGTLAGSGLDLSRVTAGCCSVREVVVMPDGAIVIKGGREGQVLVMLPTIAQGKVTWRCIGGRDEDVPSSCR